MLTINIRHDSYTGGEHYWIRFYNGQHEVRKELPEIYDRNETVFRGTYEQCVKFIEHLFVENAEYDLNL